MDFKKCTTDSIRYWEPRRVVYNVVLGLITLFYAIPFAFENQGFDWIGASIGLFILAVIANILYCAAYPVDLFVQVSDFREIWIKFRWILFLVGLGLASAFTWIFCIGIFTTLEF